jgi:hypothetical protein
MGLRQLPSHVSASDGNKLLVFSLSGQLLHQWKVLFMFTYDNALL